LNGNAGSEDSTRLTVTRGRVNELSWSQLRGKMALRLRLWFATRSGGLSKNTEKID
jgi:hypothetical protein